jgi:hypothetical protein
MKYADPILSQHLIYLLNTNNLVNRRMNLAFKRRRNQEQVRRCQQNLNGNRLKDLIVVSNALLIFKYLNFYFYFFTRALRPIKPLSKILLENGMVPTSSDTTAIGAAPPDYYTVAAKKSIYPPRHQFCSVCGLLGNYSCVRCGSKFCSLRCNANHKETRCMKFSF